MNRYADELRSEIVNAAVRQHRARKRRRALLSAAAGAVVVAGVVALIVGLLVAPGEDSATAGEAVRSTRQDDGTLIEIVAPDKPGDVITDLRAMGLSAERVERPTGPSKVGMVVSVGIDGETISTNTNHPGLLSAYVDADAKVQIGVGVATPAGGLYDVATDAFAEGEPLRCLSWPGQSTGDLATVAADEGLNLRVIDSESGPIDQLPPGRIVVAATAVAADRVIVMVGEGATTGPPPGCGSATSLG